MLRILHNTHYRFLPYWRRAVAFSATFMMLGLLAWLVRGPLDYGIEFTGGTLVQVQFDQAPATEQVRSAVSAGGISGADIQTFGAPNEFAIRAQERQEVEEQAVGAETVAGRIRVALAAQFGPERMVADAEGVRTVQREGTWQTVRTEAIGPRVGEELRRNAMIAILLSFLVTLVYLAFRFEWRFGVAAIVATAHDIITTVAFLLLLRLEITLTVVAGLLTVIGYSLNDTIVIFDRVRENLRKRRKESLAETLDRSINETLPRAVITHGTTFAATLALLLLAGPILRPFAWVFMWGLITGIFSSLYIAPPLLLWIERRWPREAGSKGGVGPRSRVDERPQASRKPQPVATR